MSNDYIPQQLLASDTVLKGFHGRQYRVDEWINPPGKSTGGSTSGYTPTTLTPRLSRARPQVYRAVNERTGKAVAVKAVEAVYEKQLINEAQALKKINFIPFLGPKIIEKPRQYKQICFFVYQWFDEENWVSLKYEIEGRGPLCKRQNFERLFERLRRSLMFRLNLIHRLGVIHGDLKPEHVLVYQQDLKHPSEFSQIRLIDFGLSYLKKTEKWRGGSVGFSNPYFWEAADRRVLDHKQLVAVDDYSANAILYHAYTGEQFPVASPTYRNLTNTRDTRVRSFYNELEEMVKRSCSQGQQPGEIDRVIERLCKPDDFGKTNHLTAVVQGLFDFIYNYAVFLVWSVLVSSTAIFSQASLSVRLVFLFITWFLLWFVYHQSELSLSQNRSLRRTVAEKNWYRVGKIALDAISILFLQFLSPIFLPGLQLILFTLPVAFVLFLLLRLPGDKIGAITYMVLGPLVLPVPILFTIPMFAGLVMEPDFRKNWWFPIPTALWVWVSVLINGRCVMPGLCTESGLGQSWPSFFLFAMAWTVIGVLFGKMRISDSRDEQKLMGLSVFILAALYPVLISLFKNRFVMHFIDQAVLAHILLVMLVYLITIFFIHNYPGKGVNNV